MTGTKKNVQISEENGIVLPVLVCTFGSLMFSICSISLTKY